MVIRMRLFHIENLDNITRSVGSTHMNQASSRSHAIFTITVECSEKVAMMTTMITMSDGDNDDEGWPLAIGHDDYNDDP